MTDGNREEAAARAAMIVFVIYTLAWEALVWGGGMFVILRYDWSPWWVLFLLLLSGMQWKAHHFTQFRTDRKDGDE